MSNTDPKLKKRILILAVPVILLCLSIWGKLIYISTVEGEVLREKSKKLAIKEREISARRGNIYSADGKLLATTTTVYNIYMDPVAPSHEDFNENISALSKALAQKFSLRNARQWENYLKSNRDKNDRYVEIAEKQSYTQLQAIKEMPLFNLGKYKGGLIVDQVNFRQKPTELAQRLIGHDLDGAQAGVEGYFSAYLEGHAGKRMMQKIGGGNWKPLNDATAVAPVDGKDIYTTLDTRIQDAAHRALLKSLTNYKADHGSVIVMEVATGRIKAIANLGLTKEGNYEEFRNYAVWESTEPGSTFKLASLLVGLEDGKIDTAQIVDTENGIYTIHDRKVKDSNVKYGRGGYGKITVAEAFRKSSNTGIVKAVYAAYQDNPQEFVDQLYNMGLHSPTGISIKGEVAPHIPKPSDKNWSGISLPWMTFGYGIHFTPLQILSLYNAIANDGVMVKPQIVTHIMQHGRTIETYQPEILNASICSKETVKQLQALLLGVVEKGTATNLKSEKLSMAGKTGTSQLNYWKNPHDYQASFAGYFPAEDPKYSCIVVVNKPDYTIGYYGNTVAGPVFRAIAEEVYLSLPEPITPEKGLSEWTLASNDKTENSLKKNYLPNLQGLTAMQAISLLENYGLTVSVTGSGRVKSQEPPIGTALRKNMTVKLALQ